MKEKDEKICKRAIRTYGKRHQIDLVIEEMAELTKELIKERRYHNNKEQIAEEMADVEIMLTQSKMIYKNHREVEKWINYKIRRLEKRLDEQEQKEIDNIVKR